MIFDIAESLFFLADLEFFVGYYRPLYPLRESGTLEAKIKLNGNESINLSHMPNGLHWDKNSRFTRISYRFSFLFYFCVQFSPFSHKIVAVDSGKGYII